jgi:hypothetical protein
METNMHQKTDEEFETELKNKPCPVCGVIGQLITQHMQLKFNYKGYPVEVEGRGWTCIDGCGQKLISDELKERLDNQTSAIDERIQNQYIVTDQKMDVMTCQTIH